MAPHKADPSQLDIFKEAAKDVVERKLKEENEQYEDKKTSLVRDIEETEAALKNSELSWQDRKEYEGDLRQYERDLASLETSHIQAVKQIMNGIEK